MTTDEILQTLVAFDTTSHKPNLEFIDWVENFFTPLGAEVTRVQGPPGKAGLIIRIGPDVPGGVVLSGHSDVVPAEEPGWDTDPFALTRVGSRLFGRGTCDMKGFIACAMQVLSKVRSDSLCRPIHLAISHDEEPGALGAPAIVERLSSISAVIVGEPTEMRVANRHKGALAENIVFRGRAAHSSRPHLGLSAVEYANRFCSGLYSLRDELMQGLQDEGVVPPYSTLNIGQFRGGVAHNIIPEAAQVIWQLRAVPSGDTQEVVSRVHDALAELSAEMFALDPACGIDIEPLFEVPPLAQEANGAAEALAAKLTGQNDTVAVTFGTEAGIFQRAGFSTVVCGPGSIEQAHMENEYVEDQQLQMCCTMLERLVRSLT